MTTDRRTYEVQRRHYIQNLKLKGLWTPDISWDMRQIDRAAWDKGVRP